MHLCAKKDRLTSCPLQDRMANGSQGHLDQLFPENNHSLLYALQCFGESDAYIMYTKEDNNAPLCCTRASIVFLGLADDQMLRMEM